eukprot:TRINITY_DN1778_c0_g1_i1.p1 TRINITY_DN1778_c0_g1~~TRINITY_DN1778_c0_g1_i1.p1  ORF type:complete len:457 (-),score=51.23 TRINITY_DN1778_c0_g1_i1:190-1401(-)
MPPSDTIDFDGFVSRRNRGSLGSIGQPPEMRQASLIKSPVSIRRDSARISGPKTASSAENKSHEIAQDVLGFTFDADRGGQLSVFLFVREIEKPLVTESSDGVDHADTKQGASATKQGASATKGPLPIRKKIELVPQRHPDGATQMEAAAVEFEVRAFGPGLGQCYESSPVDLSCWGDELFAFDPKRPQDIPIAVRMEASAVEGEPRSVHYTYISLQGRSSSAENCELGQENTIGDTPREGLFDERTGSRRGVAQIFAQKLQYGGECFVLYEVFGVTSRGTDIELDGENSDCVICLSEARDTAVLPCRHMCFCAHCAGIVRLQCDRCPICRQKVASLLQFKHDRPNDHDSGKNVSTDAGAVALPLSVAPTAMGSAFAASAASTVHWRSSVSRPSVTSSSPGSG